ncbi:MAG: DUF1822 family protein [Oscillatoriales cyanobacterium]|uniref:DUF1822 family protein n=1 Tax=Microcoleus sp. PH2017_30_WIL_O_A TaxID=2798840 RepID=UPI001DD8D5B4|nr:DUF1822 family protein [Microcoleus sp. PH2017_30_WIL_O_A]MCC3584438.1 DUF1822 family protein [Microcoleus sp. PH2017_30_WIL_O_A]TAE54634.1 MAG: DUF1822 family protein [Oscillatoriales cyanobacterium]TAE71775.1 MAG: DUF1822 family protein [Oscillatoriales cyanobacterium]
MNNTEVDLVLTIPIAPAAYRSAQTLAQQQSDRGKAKQVYLNALAVHAVDFYFQCMEIDTDLDASNIWNPAIQKFMDIADLDVKGIGKLECRWVSPGEEGVSIPAEVRSDRIGYVAVEIGQSLEEVKLLGFVKNGDREKVPLSDLESIDNLLEYLDELKPVNLSQWLHNIVGSGWHTAQTLFESKPELQFAFRSPQVVEKSASADVHVPVKRGKLLNLEWGKEQVALFVELMTTDEPDIDISVEVYPTNGQTNLPNDLQLMVLDDEGEPLMQARANKTENLLFELSGEPGEHFSVKLALGDFSVTENFLI